MPLCLNILSQTVHANGFSPVWFRRCMFISYFCLNFLSQSGQANGFSPVWILRWTVRSLRWLNLLSQQYIRTTFHQCELFDAVSMRYFVWTSSHNLDRRTAFLQCELYDAHSSSFFVWTSCHIQNRHSKVFPQCEIWDVFSIDCFVWSSYHTPYMHTAFHQYDFDDERSGYFLLWISCHNQGTQKAWAHLLYECNDANAIVLCAWTPCDKSYMCTAFHLCEFYDAHLIGHSLRISCHNLDKRMASHQCEFYDAQSSFHFVYTSCHTPHMRTALLLVITAIPAVNPAPGGHGWKIACVEMGFPHLPQPPEPSLKLWLHLFSCWKLSFGLGWICYCNCAFIREYIYFIKR